MGIIRIKSDVAIKSCTFEEKCMFILNRGEYGEEGGMSYGKFVSVAWMRQLTVITLGNSMVCCIAFQMRRAFCTAILALIFRQGTVALQNCVRAACEIVCALWHFR